MKRTLIKVAIVLLVIAAIGFAFMRSVRSTREAPYTVDAAHLQAWTFAIEPGNAPTSTLIAIRPPREMAATLFRQLFTRHAESFNGPTFPSVPLLLQDEFNRSFAGRATSGELLELARSSGLDASAFTPRCMAYRRDSAPGVTRQLYFVVFDAPAFERFRQQLATRAAPDSGFDPAALSPVMFVAASDANFGQWLSVRVNDNDCVAPMSVESRVR
jgi:hypothetical protein